MGRNISNVIVIIAVAATVLIFVIQQQATRTDRPPVTASTENKPSTSPQQIDESHSATERQLSEASRAVPPQAPIASAKELPPVEFQGKTREEIMAQVFERERAIAASQGKLAEFEEKERVQTLRREERKRIREEFRKRNNALNEQRRAANRAGMESRQSGQRTDYAVMQSAQRDERMRLREETEQAMKEANTLN